MESGYLGGSFFEFFLRLSVVQIWEWNRQSFPFCLRHQIGDHGAYEDDEGWDQGGARARRSQGGSQVDAQQGQGHSELARGRRRRRSGAAKRATQGEAQSKEGGVEAGPG